MGSRRKTTPPFSYRYIQRPAFRRGRLQAGLRRCKTVRRRQRRGGLCRRIFKKSAAARGLADGDAVEVFNDRGSFRTVLRLNEAVRPESAFMVESTYRQYLDGTIMQSVSNDQLNERGYVMPFGPMIPFNDTLIEIKKVGE